MFEVQCEFDESWKAVLAIEQQISSRNSLHPLFYGTVEVFFFLIGWEDAPTPLLWSQAIQQGLQEWKALHQGCNQTQDSRYVINAQDPVAVVS